MRGRNYDYDRLFGYQDECKLQITWMSAMMQVLRRGFIAASHLSGRVTFWAATSSSSAAVSESETHLSHRKTTSSGRVLSYYVNVVELNENNM